MIKGISPLAGLVVSSPQESLSSLSRNMLYNQMDEVFYRVSSVNIFRIDLCKSLKTHFRSIFRTYYDNNITRCLLNSCRHRYDSHFVVVEESHPSCGI